MARPRNSQTFRTDAADRRRPKPRPKPPTRTRVIGSGAIPEGPTRTSIPKREPVKVPAQVFGASVSRLRPARPGAQKRKKQKENAEVKKALAMSPQKRVQTYGFETAEEIRTYKGQLRAARRARQRPKPKTNFWGGLDDIAASLARPAVESLMSQAWGGERGGGMAPKLPRGLSAGAAGAAAGVDVLGAATLGPDLTKALRNVATGQKALPGQKGAQIGLAADVAMAPFLVGGKPLRAGRAALAAARELPKGKEAAKLAFETAMGGQTLAGKTLTAARRSVLLRSVPERDFVHTALDSQIPDKELAEHVKGQLDAHVYIATRGIPRSQRKEAARAAYRQTWSEIEPRAKASWAKTIQADMKDVSKGDRIAVHLENDLVGPHQVEGELVEAGKARLKFVDDQGRTHSVPYGDVIWAGKEGTPAPHGVALPSHEEALRTLGAPAPSTGASRKIAAEVIDSGLPLPERLRNSDELSAAIDKVFTLAREGKDYRNWYKRAALQAERVYQAYDGQVTRPQVAQLMAIFSEGNDPTANMKHVVQAIDQKLAGKPVKAGIHPARQSPEAEAVFRGEGWSGRKRNAFYANMLRHLDPEAYAKLQKDLGREGHPVTVDMWVVRMLAPWEKGKAPGASYDAYEQIMARMASELGWDPEEVQAASWVAAKSRGILGGEVRRGAGTGRVRRVPLERAYERGSDAYERGVELHLRGAEPGDAGALRRAGSLGGAEREGGDLERGRHLRGRDIGDSLSRLPEGAPPRFEELPSTTAGSRKYLDARARNPFPWSVSKPSVAQLKKSRVFLREDGEAGYAIAPDGELYGVFRNSGQGGHGYEAALQGAHRGASWLNVYDIPKISSKYEAAGWQEVARISFDPAYAPPGMPKEIGEPDIVFMGFAARPYPVRTFSNWDDAAKYTRNLSRPATPTGELAREGFEIEPSITRAVEEYRAARLARGLPVLPPLEEYAVATRLSGEHVGSARKTTLMERVKKAYREQGQMGIVPPHMRPGSLYPEKAFKKINEPPSLSAGEREDFMNRYTELFNQEATDAAEQAELDTLTDLLGMRHGIPPGAPLGASALPPLHPFQPIARNRIGENGQSLASLFGRVEEAAPQTFKEARQIVREKLPGAKGVYSRQETLRHEERVRRAGAAEEALQTGQGEQAFRAAAEEMRGEYPKLNFKGFRQLDQEGFEALTDHIRTHPNLQTWERYRAYKGLLGAMGGKVPTPSEQLLLERVFGKDVAENIKAAHTWAAKAKSLGLELWNLPRSLMSSLDLSAPFRQGLVTAPRYPRLFGQNMGHMIKAFGSERVYENIMGEILERPNFGLYQQSKLAFTDITDDLAKREEAFMSNLAERLPIAGRGVRASSRAYTGFLNKMRADVFDFLIEKAREQGVNVTDEKFLTSLGRFVNSATGRGDLGALQKHSVTLSSALWSPRLLWSRLNFLNPVYYARLDPWVRKEALKSAMTLGGTVGMVLFLAKMGGANVETDPRSADFAKIRVGNTRVDILGGFQQPIRLVSQLASGKIISSTTGQTMTLGSDFGDMSRFDIAVRFARSKANPALGPIWDWMEGTDFEGQPFEIKKAIYSRMVSLLLWDAVQIYRDTGNVGHAAGVWGLGLFGIGTQTYGKKPARPASPSGSSYGGSYGGGSSYSGTYGG